MEYSQKQVASDDHPSSDDEANEVKEMVEAARNNKRSYECTFCKRGFTNAQALGGHMNIHRKDRAKAAKQITTTSSKQPAMIISEDCTNYVMNNLPRYNSNISNDHDHDHDHDHNQYHHHSSSRYYPVFESQRNYPAMFYHQQQPSGSSPNPSPRYHPSSQSLSMINAESLGPNLSLGLGPTCVDHDHDHDHENEVMRRGFVEEAGLDLELRLGRNR